MYLIELAKQIIDIYTLAATVTIVILILCAFVVSAFEAASYALNHNDLNQIRSVKSIRNLRLIRLLESKDKLQMTFLLSSTFFVVAIVVIIAYLVYHWFDLISIRPVAFFIEVVVITFILLLVVEIIPKRIVHNNPKMYLLIFSPLIVFLSWFFSPLSYLFSKFLSIVKNKNISNRKNISISELSDAIELAKEDIKDEKEILKGIVKFANIEVTDIMKSRVDVTSVEIETNFRDLIRIINESGYSRIPVFEETFDNIKGILYVKDLIPHLHKTNTFKWQSLIRPPYFIPETKKINILLKEFQTQKIHMAIVVDEYGGSSGIITLEDILEEIVGEISDESDDDEHIFVRLNDNNYLFEGKALLNDFYKALNIEDDLFADIRGEADTLAGLILELTGEIPEKGKVISCKGFVFTIRSVDKRRIKQIHVSLPD